VATEHTEGTEGAGGADVVILGGVAMVMGEARLFREDRAFFVIKADDQEDCHVRCDSRCG